MIDYSDEIDIPVIGGEGKKIGKIVVKKNYISLANDLS